MAEGGHSLQPLIFNSLNQEGYGYTFVDEKEALEYECPFCLHVVRAPILIPCGDFACRDCWKHWASNQEAHGDKVFCPVCQDSLKGDPIVENRYILRKVQCLRVYCNYKSNGCEKILELSKIEDHHLYCDFQTVPCELSCGEYITLKFMEQHIEMLCPKRQATCSMCQQTVTVEMLQNSHTLHSSENKDITSLTEHVKLQNEKIISQNANIISDNKSIISQNTHMMLENKNIAAQNANIRFQNENIALQDDKIDFLMASIEAFKLVMEEQQATIQVLSKQISVLLKSENHSEISHQVMLENKITEQDGSSETSNQASSVIHSFIHAARHNGHHHILLDGPFIWHLLLNRKSGRVTSDNFYSRDNLKCYFKLRILSDGSMCLYAYMSNGEYDNEITWPIKRLRCSSKVTEPDNGLVVHSSKRCVRENLSRPYSRVINVLKPYFLFEIFIPELKLDNNTRSYDLELSF